MPATPPTVLPAATIDVRSLVEGIPLQVWQLVLMSAVGLSVVVLYRLARPDGRWGQRLRSRFVLGVPWGTLLGLSVVVLVYLFVQGGLGHRFDPVSLPFRATSYAYPLGVVLAGFSHLGWGHLLGNLFSGLVYGSIAEYAWSHFPTDRGTQSFASRMTNPFVRIGLFFGAILLTGLLTAAFSWGPIIGFSGVVYTLAGFALVFYPIATLVAVVGWSQLWHLWGAWVDPITIAEPSVRYSGVGWANVAVQGHAFGFLIGVVIGALVLRSRRQSAKPARIWLAAMVYTIANGLWQVFWYLGNSQFLRLEGLGTALLFVLAGLIVAAVAGSEGSLIGRVGSISSWRVAASVIVITLLSMSMVGAAINLSAPSSGELPDDAVEIRDYEIAYAENVTNQQIAVVNLPFLNQVTEIRTSGVIVYSEDRRLWHQVVTKRALEARGSGRVLLGGVGWRTAVNAYRSGWSVVGGDVTYRVFLRPDGEQRRLVHTSAPAVADVRLQNRTVAIQPGDSTFEIAVRLGNETLATGSVPANGGNVTLGGVTFDRENRALYASIDGTELKIANRRIPPTQQQ